MVRADDTAEGRGHLANSEAFTEADHNRAVDDLRIAMLAKSDPREFAPLYDRYVEPIYVYCHRHLHQALDAEDASSLVFIKALEALPRFQPRASEYGSTFRAWLFTIARNIVIDMLRRRRPQVSVDALGLDSSWLIDRAPGPESQAIHADESARLLAQLERLPERQRAAVELRLSGLSGPEIAVSLGLSLSAVKSLQVRAYRSLRQGLTPAVTISEEIQT